MVTRNNESGRLPLPPVTDSIYQNMEPLPEAPRGRVLQGKGRRKESFRKQLEFDS